MNGAPQALLDEVALAARVDRLARAIAEDHPDGVVLVGVLKGALLFTADLARALARVAPGLDVRLDFLAVSRYAPESGRVKILKDLDLDVAGCDVVLVEDLVDTGLTLAYLLGQLEARAPRTLDVCTLLDRSERRIVPVQPRYVGEAIPGDAFVLGYGLHVGERYRNLPLVMDVDQAAVVADPDAFLALYGDESGLEAQDASKRRDARVGDEVERRRP